LIKPILKQISAFDKNDSVNFHFNFYGNQPMKNRLIIKNNITNAVIYNKIQETLHSYHILSSNTLVNGNVYNAQLSIFDENDVESDLSNTVTFHCYSTPLFSFINLNTTTNQVKNSN